MEKKINLIFALYVNSVYLRIFGKDNFTEIQKPYKDASIPRKSAYENILTLKNVIFTRNCHAGPSFSRYKYQSMTQSMH